MKSLFITTLLTLSISAFASEKEAPAHPRGGKGKCFKELDLSPQQKKDIKAARLKSKADILKLKPSVAIAQANLTKILLDPLTTKQEAIDARKKVRKARKPIRKIRRQTRLKVQFDILTGEQRVKLYVCRKTSGAGRGHRRGHRRH